MPVCVHHGRRNLHGDAPDTHSCWNTRGDRVRLGATHGIIRRNIQSMRNKRIDHPRSMSTKRGNPTFESDVAWIAMAIALQICRQGQTRRVRIPSTWDSLGESSMLIYAWIESRYQARYFCRTFPWERCALHPHNRQEWRWTSGRMLEILLRSYILKSDIRNHKNEWYTGT